MDTRDQELRAVLKGVFGEQKPPPAARPAQPVELDDRELLEKAFAARNGPDFQRLYQGDTSAYPSASEAELAFCRTAAFWTGRDPARIDAWVRSSGLMREKWNRDDYRERTIDAAIATTSDVYNPTPKRAEHGGAANEATQSDKEPFSLTTRTLEQFAATEEEGAHELVGEPGQALIPTGGNVMVYGDGGAGKTTLTIDLACHLAAAANWIGITIAAQARSLIIEDEGPRAFFRRKLARKLEAWTGPPLDGRVHIVEHPWATFSFAHESHRAALAAETDRLSLAVVIVGPVVVAGMEKAGTLQDVREFLALVDDVRNRSSHNTLTFILIHHENKGGEVSGAWEGAGDTLIHLSSQGHGKSRLHIQKARHAPDYHLKTLALDWGDGETFTVAEKDLIDDDTIETKILDAISHEPGIRWTAIEKTVLGISHDRRRGIRDRLLAAGRIVNRARDSGGNDTVFAYCEERKATSLYPLDDPTIKHLLPARQRGERTENDLF